LQKSIYVFESLDVAVALKCIREDSVREPRIELPYSDEAEARAFRIFDLLL